MKIIIIMVRDYFHLHMPSTNADMMLVFAFPDRHTHTHTCMRAHTHNPIGTGWLLPAAPNHDPQPSRA